MTTELILALNAGSSTVKGGLYQIRDGAAAELARSLQAAHGEAEVAQAAMQLLAWAHAAAPGGSVVAVGHRVVHGGSEFTGPALITPQVLAALDALTPLAPLHQPLSLAGARALASSWPDLPQVACFDTSFHRTQPEIATLYALPLEVRQKGVRRYGFHGLSYEHLSRRLLALDPELSRGRVILAHLGSGASLCATLGGRSIDTTMGFSALDGLVMSTRPGELDPGVVLNLQQQHGLGPAEIEDLLYRRSGLLGVSGLSGDMRTLLDSADPRAKAAVELFTYRLARAGGALVSSLGGLDGVVFSGGIGEHSPEIRAMAADRLAWLGLELDRRANAVGGEAPIHTLQSRIKAWIIPTDEEQVIARQTLQRLAD